MLGKIQSSEPTSITKTTQMHKILACQPFAVSVLDIKAPYAGSYITHSWNSA